MSLAVFVHAQAVAVSVKALKAFLFKSISWLASSQLHVSYIHQVYHSVVV